MAGMVTPDMQPNLWYVSPHIRCVPQGWNGCMNMVWSTAVGGSVDESLEYYFCPSGIHEGTNEMSCRPVARHSVTPASPCSTTVCNTCMCMREGLGPAVTDGG